MGDIVLLSNHRTDDKSYNSPSLTKSTPGILTINLPPMADDTYSHARPTSVRRTPRFTPREIVTPKTIIPACYFHILSTEWSASSQTYLYTIKTLPSHGDHMQPDLTRTVPEDVLDSQTNLRQRQELSSMHDTAPDNAPSTDEAHSSLASLNLNTAAEIEVGDFVSVLVKSVAGDPFAPPRDTDACLPGTVVGTEAQAGLWTCFLVTLDKYRHTGRTLPCTERLLMLTRKGMHSKKQACTRSVAKVWGPESRKVMRPVFVRKVTEAAGLITWSDCGKEAALNQLLEK